MSRSALPSKPLPPNATIGLVGGGQLGRMLASAAARLGYRTVTLEPVAGAPAAQVCNHHIEAAYDDETALAKLAAQCDVVTYEFENVPLQAAQVLERDVSLFPSSYALEVAQDRLVEKNTLQVAGVPVAPFVPVEDVEDLIGGLRTFGGGVLKTRRFGYDGKGQQVIDGVPVEGDLAEVLQSLGQGPFVLEQKIAFDREFSLIAVRGKEGVAIFDPAVNEHREGILRTSTVPAGLPAAVLEDASSIAHLILEDLDYIGVLGIEFFQRGDTLMVNEIAPRVHNSGHWTVEACATSQFEQHIRAICGLPLGSVQRHHDCEMINLIGDDIADLSKWFDRHDAVVTLYGKMQSRAGRKMGHVTRLLSR